MNRATQKQADPKGATNLAMAVGTRQDHFRSWFPAKPIDPSELPFCYESAILLQEPLILIVLKLVVHHLLGTTFE